MEAVMISYTSKSPSGNDDTENVSWLSLPCAGPAGVLAAARAEALFSSDVSACSPVTPDEVKDAIRRAVRSNGGVRGCAAQVATAYGDHPETAAPRMRWARHVVDSVYGKSISATDELADGQTAAPRRGRDLDGVRSRAAGDRRRQGPKLMPEGRAGLGRRSSVRPRAIAQAAEILNRVPAGS
jgi:hypothetical protein